MKEVYVFGAGASFASAGAPLAKDLVWHFSSDFGDKFENDRLFEKFLKAGIQYVPEFEGELKKFQARGEYLYNPPPFLKKEFYIDDLLSRTQKDGDEKTKEIIRQIIFEHIVQSHIDIESSRIIYEYPNIQIKTSGFGGYLADKLG